MRAAPAQAELGRCSSSQLHTLRFRSQRWLRRPFHSSPLVRFHCNATRNGPFYLIFLELGGLYKACVTRAVCRPSRARKERQKIWNTPYWSDETAHPIRDFPALCPPLFPFKFYHFLPPTPCFIFFIFPNSAPFLNLREDIRSGCLWKTQHLRWNWFFSRGETDGSLCVPDRSSADCLCHADKHEGTHTCTGRGWEDKRDCLCWGRINFYEFWIAVYEKIHF